MIKYKTDAEQICNENVLDGGSWGRGDTWRILSFRTNSLAQLAGTTLKIWESLALGDLNGVYDTVS